MFKKLRKWCSIESRHFPVYTDGFDVKLLQKKAEQGMGINPDTDFDELMRYKQTACVNICVYHQMPTIVGKWLGYKRKDKILHCDGCKMYGHSICPAMQNNPGDDHV